MKQLVTAEEFIRENLTDYWQGGKAQYTGEDVEKAMIEFAKLHVQAALESAAENARIKTEYYNEEDVGRTRLREILDSSDLASERTDGDGIMYAVDTYEVNKQSILNAYPLNNIK